MQGGPGTPQYIAVILIQGPSSRATYHLALTEYSGVYTQAIYGTVNVTKTVFGPGADSYSNERFNASRLILGT